MPLRSASGHRVVRVRVGEEGAVDGVDALFFEARHERVPDRVGLFRIERHHHHGELRTVAFDVTLERNDPFTGEASLVQIGPGAVHEVVDGAMRSNMYEPEVLGGRSDKRNSERTVGEVSIGERSEVELFVELLPRRDGDVDCGALVPEPERLGRPLLEGLSDPVVGARRGTVALSPVLPEVVPEVDLKDDAVGLKRPSDRIVVEHLSDVRAPRDPRVQDVGALVDLAYQGVEIGRIRLVVADAVTEGDRVPEDQDAKPSLRRLHRAGRARAQIVDGRLDPVLVFVIDAYIVGVEVTRQNRPHHRMKAVDVLRHLADELGRNDEAQEQLEARETENAGHQQNEQVRPDSAAHPRTRIAFHRSGATHIAVSTYPVQSEVGDTLRHLLRERRPRFARRVRAQRFAPAAELTNLTDQGHASNAPAITLGKSGDSAYVFSPMKLSLRLLSPLLALAPLTATAQEFEAPPPIAESEPFEERVYDDEPFETMTTAPPTADPNAPIAVAQDDDDDRRPPTMAEFEATLNPHGRWVVSGAYGRVWVPRAPYAGWRPYSNGQWVHTADGWTFVSYDSWGWAPFHYGRWVYLRRHGWSWIPGYEWSPAWVQWRYGGDYVAWAPLGPSGVAVSYYDSPSLWFAVRSSHFGGRVHRKHFVPTTGVNVVFKSTRTGRPTVTYVQSATGRPVKSVRVHRRAHRARAAERRMDRREQRREVKKDRRDERREVKKERQERRMDRRDDRRARPARRRD